VQYTVHMWVLLLLLLLAGCAHEGGGELARPANVPDSLVEADPGAQLRGMIVVTQNTGSAVTFVNPDTRKIFAYAPVGWNPREIAVSPDQGLIFISNYSGGQFGAGTISVVSTASRREIDRLDFYPYGKFHGMACSRSGVYLYVASETRSTILEVNLMSRLVERTFAIPRGVPNEVALDPSETRLFVSDLAGSSVYAINLAGGVVQEGRSGTSPEGLSLSPDGSMLWVCNRDDGTVSILDPYTLALQGTLNSGRSPVRVAFTPDGNRAYVVNAGEAAVTVFDPRSRARLGSVPVGLYPLGIAIDIDGTKAYVASTRDDEISVIDLGTNNVIERIPVGPEPFDLAWVGR
jgi:YVTN family beta-propeller protein